MVKATYAKIILLTVAFLITGPAFASAANLDFSEPSNYYEVGNTFSLRVLVTGANQPVNAVSGVISFPKDKIEVISISKTSSVVNLWVQDPSFSNIDGTVTFEGIILNPGFTGESGRIIAVNFKAKKDGLASINFLSGSVLANDGKGTNVLNNLGNAQINISALAPITTKRLPVVTVPVGTAAIPKVTSPTHPDPSKWYANADITFQWDNMPKDAVDVSFVLDTHPLSTTEKVRGVINTYTYKDIEDGVWYFHIKYKNQNGWGQTANFAVQIDTQKPKPIVLSFPHGASSLDNRPVALFNTTDSLSGIDHYEVKIGDKHSYQLLPDAIAPSNPYVIPPQEPGVYSIKVVAYDKAGNSTQATDSFEIIGLDLPQVISIPDKISEGDVFRITGRSYPTATVVAILKKNGQTIEEQNIFTNNLGQFTLTWPTYLPSGRYEIAFFVADENNAKSLQTPEKTLIVEKKYLVNLGVIRLTLSMAIWLNVILFLVVNSLIGYWIYRFSHTKTRFTKRFSQVEGELNELIIYLSSKLPKEDLDSVNHRIQKSIAKMKKIIKDIHKL